MTWSEAGKRDGLPLSAALAPYTVRTTRHARRLVQLSVRYIRSAISGTIPS